MVEVEVTSPGPKPRLLRYFIQDPERIEERLVVRRLDDLVVLGIRLQVDLVSELGVPIKDRKGDSSVTASRLWVVTIDDRCGGVYPATHSVVGRVVAGSPYDTSASHHLPSDIHTPYPIGHDPQPYHKPAGHDPRPGPTTTPIPSRAPPATCHLPPPSTPTFESRYSDSQFNLQPLHPIHTLVPPLL